MRSHTGSVGCCFMGDLFTVSVGALCAVWMLTTFSVIGSEEERMRSVMQVTPPTCFHARSLDVPRTFSNEEDAAFDKKINKFLADTNLSVEAFVKGVSVLLVQQLAGCTRGTLETLLKERGFSESSSSGFNELDVGEINAMSEWFKAHPGEGYGKSPGIALETHRYLIKRDREFAWGKCDVFAQVTYPRKDSDWTAISCVCEHALNTSASSWEASEKCATGTVVAAVLASDCWTTTRERFLKKYQTIRCVEVSYDAMPNPWRDSLAPCFLVRLGYSRLSGEDGSLRQILFAVEQKRDDSESTNCEASDWNNVCVSNEAYNVRFRQMTSSPTCLRIGDKSPYSAKEMTK